MEWQAVRDAAMQFCQQKKDAHRFDGKGNFDTSQVTTFDLIQKKETIPWCVVSSEIPEILLSEAFHFESLGHGFQEMLNFISPEGILWIDLAGSGVFPV
jgi:hypothetical protein